MKAHYICIYSYRAIIEMDKRNQLWLFCTYSFTGSSFS